jgi:hypothetical protein
MKKPALNAEINTDAARLRNLIQDERGRFWTGRGFSRDNREALAYSNPLVVHQNIQRLHGRADPRNQPALICLAICFGTADRGGVRLG